MALAFYYRQAHALPQANIHASKMADIGTLQELPFYLMRKHVHRINVTQSELCTGKGQEVPVDLGLDKMKLMRKRAAKKRRENNEDKITVD